MTRASSARSALAALLALVAAALLGACNSSTAVTASGGKPLVVAAENVWGSLAHQIGGDRVDVVSLITNPNTDPHAYEPTPADARTLAGAQLAIVNGVGYDPWAAKLIAANGREPIVLTVGDLVGARSGDNPHRWYDPANVEQVVGAVTADLQRLDPKDALSFIHQRTQLETRGLARYRALIAAIKSRYAGVPVGASESIVAPLLAALGLDLVTPPGYIKAISEGSDPTAQDKGTVDAQITRKLIKLWILNSQNVTPDSQRLTSAARARGIPVTTVTETLAPASASFQDWQSAQLQDLQRALAQATGR
ncbi:MAG: metal ABC transporter solute-binding protein, Zn/Mn family [Solirubrobacteraceae bacterium]|nr:MAG: ABC transporter substrate-binding protein [Solirubrobacterales bacterium]